MDDLPVRARIPADIEAPDRILYQLTARQVAILAATIAVCYLLFTATRQTVPLPVAAIVLAPILGAAGAVALARRDGLPMDQWLHAALVYRRTPRRAAPAVEAAGPLPGWAPLERRPVQPALLRLPASAIADNGVIDTSDSRAVALVAATTVNVGLRTGAEQAAIVGGYARWLNSLTGPVQIIVSAQRFDLAGHADRVAAGIPAMQHPALADAALDYAHFLLDIAEQRDPLCRTVTVACTAVGSPRTAPAEVLRQAEQTATALAALGAQTRVLDGEQAAAVLTAATDPFQPADAGWPRSLPQHPVTGPAVPGRAS